MVRVAFDTTGCVLPHFISVRAHEPLRVTLSDLRSAEKRGKWWLIGAAWNGNPLVEKTNEIQLASSQTQSDDSLLKLARKQGMNTDVRRSIFVVLMSSDVISSHYRAFESKA